MGLTTAAAGGPGTLGGGGCRAGAAEDGVAAGEAAAEGAHIGAFTSGAPGLDYPGYGDDGGEEAAAMGYDENGMALGAEGYYYDGQEVAFDFPDEETFLTPQLWSATAEPAPGLEAESAEAGAPPGLDGTVAGLRVEGRRILWDVCTGLTDPRVSLMAVPKGECLESPPFWIAGTELRLAFYPVGTALSGDTDCSAELLCEDKAKLKFELFMNGRSGGRKVLLGKRFSCDFRKPVSLTSPDADAECVVAVGVQVHENFLYAGFF